MVVDVQERDRPGLVDAVDIERYVVASDQIDVERREGLQRCKSGKSAGSGGWARFLAEGKVAVLGSTSVDDEVVAPRGWLQLPKCAAGRSPLPTLGRAERARLLTHEDDPRLIADDQRRTRIDWP